MIGVFLATAALTAAVAATSPTDARDAYAARQTLLAADARCGLLPAGARAALAGAALQARGALLRAGQNPDAIARNAAARADATDCADDSLLTTAAAARAAFAAWAATPRQDFPGMAQDWTAVRPGATDAPHWTLWQELEGGARFGVMQGPTGRTLALALPRGAGTPRALSLGFRDADRWAIYVDPALGGLFAAPDGLAGRVAPASMRREIMSAGPVPGAAPGAGAWTWWAFPEDALARMALLDPRDAARIAIDYADNRAGALYVEIGDLATALGFLAAGATD